MEKLKFYRKRLASAGFYLLLHGQAKLHLRPDAGVGKHQFAAVGLGDAAGEIQPQPLVAVAGAGGVGIEELPGLVQGFGREAWAGIGDSENQRVLCLADIQRDGAACGSIAHGVVQHVFKCTAEFRGGAEKLALPLLLQNKVELRRAAEGVGRIRQRGNKGMAVGTLAGGGHRAHTAQGGKVLLGAVPCPQDGVQFGSGGVGAFGQ